MMWHTVFKKLLECVAPRSVIGSLCGALQKTDAPLKFAMRNFSVVGVATRNRAAKTDLRMLQTKISLFPIQFNEILLCGGSVEVCPRNKLRTLTPSHSNTVSFSILWTKKIVVLFQKGLLPHTQPRKLSSTTIFHRYIQRIMTEEVPAQSAPTKHGIGRWRLSILGRLGFGRRNSKEMSRFNIPSTTARNPKTRDKKDAFRLRTFAQDPTLKTIPNKCRTELLIFSGISKSQSVSTSSSSLDCDETTSISFSSEERDDDWTIMSSPKGAKECQHGKDDLFQSLAATDLSSSALTLEGLPEEDDDHRSFCSCEENREVMPQSPPLLRVVRFADEEGLPMEDVCHLPTTDEVDVFDRNHYEELVVLCLCLQERKFEFLHLGYFPLANVEKFRRATNVHDLLQTIPRMATDRLFQHAAFDTFYRITDCTEGGSIGVERSSDDTNLLRDCNFRRNELIVVVIEECQPDDLLLELRPLLGNAKLMKRVRRSQQSGRGLKLVTDDDDDDDNQNLKMKRRTNGKPESSQRGRTSLRKHCNPIVSSTKDPRDVFGNDVEHRSFESLHHQEDEVTENARGQLLQAAFMISAGTIFLSSIGIC
jgi:hypothetical protein